MRGLGVVSPKQEGRHRNRALGRSFSGLRAKTKRRRGNAPGERIAVVDTTPKLLNRAAAVSRGSAEEHAASRSDEGRQKGHRAGRARRRSNSPGSYRPRYGAFSEPSNGSATPLDDRAERLASGHPGLLHRLTKRLRLSGLSFGFKAEGEPVVAPNAGRDFLHFVERTLDGGRRARHAALRERLGQRLSPDTDHALDDRDVCGVDNIRHPLDPVLVDAELSPLAECGLVKRVGVTAREKALGQGLASATLDYKLSFVNVSQKPFFNLLRRQVLFKHFLRATASGRKHIGAVLHAHLGRRDQLLHRLSPDLPSFRSAGGKRV